MKLFICIFIFIALSLRTFCQCSISIEEIRRPSCESNNEGILSAINLIGAAPFTFLWSNSHTSNVIDSLSAGIYSVTMTDSTGCSATANIFLFQEMNVVISSIPISCSSCCDGSAIAIPGSGTPPFQYNWTSGNTTPAISGLCIGSYSCCITDSVGCMSCVTVDIPIDTVKKRISGFIFYDADSNKVFNSGDYSLRGAASIMLLPDSLTAYADESGQYWFAVDSGNYVLIVDTLGAAVDSLFNFNSDSIEYHISVNQNSLIGYNFGFKPNRNIHSVHSTFTRHQPRCTDGIGQTLILISNTGTYVESLRITMAYSSNMDFLSSNTFPTSFSGDTLTWQISSLLPSAELYLLPEFLFPSVGSVVQFSVLVERIDSAGPVANPILGDTSHVLCGADPNEKTVTPNDTVLYNQELQYTIWFQNTGNDTAFNVIIIDTLDSKLDPTTFHLIAASHSFNLQINRTVNEMHFSFSNIQLPDSNIDEYHSHGFVQYSVKAKAGLSLPADVYNTAHIYFDFNPEISTNTAYNTLISNTSNVELLNMTSNFIVAPNPCKDYCALYFDSEIKLSKILILDLLGSPIAEFENITGNEVLLDRRLFPAGGIYLIRAFDKNFEVSCIKKLIIY